MEKILYVSKRTFAVLLIALMLSILIVPVVQAYYTDGMKVGEKYKSTKEIKVYRDKNCVLLRTKLAKNKEFKIEGINKNVLKIGNQKYIKCTNDVKKNLKKVNDTTKKVNVTAITLNKTSAFLDITKPSLKLTVTITPSNANNKKIEWTSSNAKVAKVDENGNVIRVGEGVANIIAKVDGKQAICKVTVRKEKLIICGPSTVAQLAGEREISTKNNDFWKTDYSKYGYKKAEGYKKIRDSKGNLVETKYIYKEDDDLFFICRRGAGLKHFDINSNMGEIDKYLEKDISIYDTADEKKQGKEGGIILQEILDKYKNKAEIHFTVVFVGSGNDLMKKDMSAGIIEKIAKAYYNYLCKLSDKYPNYTFHAFPATPIDEESATEKDKNILVQSYEVGNSNNLKRYKFAKALKELIVSKNNKRENLKYSTGTFIDLLEQSSYDSGVAKRIKIKEDGKNKTYVFITKRFGNGKYIGAGKKYKCFDGKHYTADGCEFVLKEILKRAEVVNSNYKKK